MTDPHPTRVRYAVVAVTALMSVLLYLDRNCFPFMAASVREYLGIDALSMGWVIGSFYFTYALAQVPTGWLSDRFGARKMLTLYIVMWSVFTASMGWATGLLTLIAARLAFGVAQAGAYPTAAALIGRWVPLQGRGKANSIVALGGRLGGSIATFLTALLLFAFLPLSASSLLTHDDLLDPVKLGQQVQSPEDTPTGRLAAHLSERLPAEVKKSLPRSGPKTLPGPISDVERTTVIEGLNQLLLRSDLTDGLNLEGLNLPQETQRLLAISADLRTPEETQRLNRILVETAFPSTLRSLYGQNWSKVLWVYGAVGLAVALLFWFIVRDRPRDHPWTNTAEAQWVGDPEASTTASQPSGIPLGVFLRSRNMWMSGLCQFGINFGWVFILNQLPDYLSQVHKVPLDQRGLMAGLPLGLSIIGMFLGGALTDRLARTIGRRWGRALPIGLTQLLCGGIFLISLFLPSAWAMVAAVSLMAVMVDLGVPSIWAFAQDIGGRNVGSTIGWGNMWGNFGAAVSPIVLTSIQLWAGWPPVFVSCAAAFVVAGLAGLSLDASKPLDRA